MKLSYPIHKEMSQVVSLVRQYFMGRVRKDSIETLGQVIRDLRVVLQQVVSSYFLHLPLPQGREFRAALADQLMGICSEVYATGSREDESHHRYCIKEIMVCFEWAEQIKEEIPDDPVTQKILAVDIPILRPFDYGLGRRVSKGPKHR